MHPLAASLRLQKYFALELILVTHHASQFLYFSIPES